MYRYRYRYLPQTKHTVVFFKFFSIITEQELCGSPGRSISVLPVPTKLKLQNLTPAPSAGIKKNVTSITHKIGGNTMQTIATLQSNGISHPSQQVTLTY